jgi:hypothetical protein
MLIIIVSLIIYFIGWAVMSAVFLAGDNDDTYLGDLTNGDDKAVFVCGLFWPFFIIFLIFLKVCDITSKLFSLMYTIPKRLSTTKVIKEIASFLDRNF